MKSPMITKADYIPEQQKNGYTELQALKSAAGFYIGTMYVEDGFEMPGSRDSGYFATKAEAEEHLRAITQDGAPTRMEP